MIIVSQDKKGIINFNNIMSIDIIDAEKDGWLISAAFLIGIDDIYRELGYYKTEKRAQEVLQEIVSKYRQYNLDNNKAITILPKVYEMPKE